MSINLLQLIRYHYYFHVKPQRQRLLLQFSQLIVELTRRLKLAQPRANYWRPKKVMMAYLSMLRPLMLVIVEEMDHLEVDWPLFEKEMVQLMETTTRMVMLHSN